MKRCVYCLIPFAFICFLLCNSCRNNASENLLLKELEVKGFVLSPAFSPEQTSYVIVTPSFEHNVEVRATAQGTSVMVLISHFNDIITVKVASVTSNNEKIYTIRLKKPNFADFSLSSLFLFAESSEGEKKIPFTQMFEKQITSYTALVPFNLTGQLDVFYKTNYQKRARVKVTKEPDVLGNNAGDVQIFTISLFEPTHLYSKEYTIKCVRQKLSTNTNIEYVKVLDKNALFKQGEFYSLVPFSTEQKKIEESIIVGLETFSSTSAVREADSSLLEKQAGAVKKYVITVTAEDNTKTQDYVLNVIRKPFVSANIESVSVNGISANKQINGNYSAFIPYNLDATKLDSSIDVKFENDEKYSYSIEAKTKTPLGKASFSYKEYEIVIFLGDEKLATELTIFRDLENIDDRKMVEVLSEKKEFVGAKPTWLEPSNPDYRELLGSFKDGENISIEPFSMGMYEITFELWQGVYSWASKNEYYFENRGKCGSANAGSSRQPVTDIAWRDAIVWCNAYSEMMGKEPCYYSDSECLHPIKTSITDYEHREKHIEDAGSIDMPYIKKTADGSRLPFSYEWEMSSRGGDEQNELHWNFKYAGSDSSEDVAVFFTSEDKNKSTSIVGSKIANRLGLYDMSGNVFEWCMDTLTDGEHYYKMQRGGAFYSHPSTLYVTFTGVASSYQHYNNRGLRVATSKR